MNVERVATSPQAQAGTPAPPSNPPSSAASTERVTLGSGEGSFTPKLKEQIWQSCRTVPPPPSVPLLEVESNQVVTLPADADRVSAGLQAGRHYDVVPDGWNIAP